MIGHLVYVSESWAYFTTRPDWQNQWGDDWNDAPYEHNAGEPYRWMPYMAERGIEPYEIIKLAYDGPLVTPDWSQLNSPWSVQQINAGAVPWLQPFTTSDVQVFIRAGVSVEEFQKLLAHAGGDVYRKVER